MQTQLFNFDLNKHNLHWELREILSGYLNQKPDKIYFYKNSNGKLFHPKVFFSLSHSHNLGVIAINRFEPIGIDIEYIRPITRELSIKKRFFSPFEDTEKSFLELWTAKEALLKVTGARLLEGIKKPIDWKRVVPILTFQGYVGHLAF